MNDLPTPLEATVTDWKPNLDEYRTVLAEKQRLTDDLERVRQMYQSSNNTLQEYRQKIANVKGYISDIYSEDGEIDERVKDIARLLDIELTKRISGTADFSISWSAQVPIDFNADDFEISFDVDCETYEAEDFDWQEENTEVHAEED